MKKIVIILTVPLFNISCHFNNSQDQNSLGSGKGKTYNLIFAPENGSHYYYDVSNESNYKVEVNSQKINNSSKLTVGLNYKINTIDPDSIELILQYDKIRLHSEKGGVKTDIDADNPPNAFNPTETMLRDLKKMRITAFIDSFGMIKSIGSYKEIEASILSDLNLNDENSRAIAQKELDQLIGNKLINGNLEGIVKLLPKQGVHVGEKWNKISKQMDEFHYNMNTNYQLKEVNDNMATITSKADMSSDNAEINLMGNEVTANLKGQQVGKYEIDVKTGILVKSEVSANLAGTLQTMGRKIPVTIESKVKINGVKRK